MLNRHYQYVVISENLPKMDTDLSKREFGETLLNKIIRSTCGETEGIKKREKRSKIHSSFHYHPSLFWSLFHENLQPFRGIFLAITVPIRFIKDLLQSEVKSFPFFWIVLIYSIDLYPSLGFPLIFPRIINRKSFPCFPWIGVPIISFGVFLFRFMVLCFLILYLNKLIFLYHKYEGRCRNPTARKWRV